MADHILNGIDDADIAGATAQVTTEFMADRRLIRVLEPGNDIARSGQHPGGAEPALQGVMAGKSGAQPLHQRIVAIAFDGFDLRALTPMGEGDARAHRLAIHHHRAGAADPLFAGQMGAGQIEVIAQHFGQLGARCDRYGERFAIDGQGQDFSHAKASRTDR